MRHGESADVAFWKIGDRLQFTAWVRQFGTLSAFPR